jgi:hypothetical protein
VKASPIATRRLRSLRLFSTPPKPLISQIPSAEPKIPWGKFELRSLTGNRQIPLVFGWPMGFLAGWANISLSPRILEDQRCE